MRIEDVTQTKDGTPWEFFKRLWNGLVIGAWTNGFGHIRPGIWNSDGNCIDVLGEGAHYHNLNLDLHDWRDDIPWELLKNWIRWIAMDEDGEWRGYEIEPACDPNRWYSARRRKATTLSGVKMPTPPHWRSSKVERPEGK